MIFSSVGNTAHLFVCHGRMKVTRIWNYVRRNKWWQKFNSCLNYSWRSKINSVFLTSLSQDAVPFFVNATAGTTVLGAFDPLNRIADISERNGIWMHVDVRIAHIPYVTSHCLSIYSCLNFIGMLFVCSFFAFQHYNLDPIPFSLICRLHGAEACCSPKNTDIWSLE